MAAIDQSIAYEAQRIIEGKAFDAAIAHLKEAAVTELVSTEPADSDQRELLYMRLRSLDDVRVTLRNFAQTVERKE